MDIVILDLEWNGTYSRRLKGYINEIIEFGAVKCGPDLSEKSTFSCFVKPQVAKHISSTIQSLTSITDENLTGGLPFSEWEELVDGVNAILDQAREGRRTAQREEAALKEAITHLSHDIRTPLTSLDGYFQLLLQSPSAEEQQRYSAVIQSRIASLRDMLEELFTYARLQDKEAPLALEPVDFAACVYDTVFAFYEDFQAKGLTPQADFCDGHLWVQGNGEALRRTVQNLVKNALEHGGREIAFALFQRDGAAGFRCTNQVDRPEEITEDIVKVSAYCRRGAAEAEPVLAPRWRRVWRAPSGRRWRGTPFPSP